MLNALKGFRNKKKPTTAQLEEYEAIKNFMDDYRATCLKHGLQLAPIIKTQEHGGLMPDFKIAKYTPPAEPELKNWGDASEENLKNMKVCRHLNVGENCKNCGVRVADQDPSGTGITPEYEAIKVKKIADYRAKEEVHNGQGGKDK